MFRLPFRLTTLSAIELGLAALFVLIGLILTLGTTDEYKAGRAFNRAMDNYSAGILEDVYRDLELAMAAKPDYAAPREAYAKLMVDEGYRNAAKFAEAIGICQELARHQEARGGRPSLPVLITTAVAGLEAVRAGSPAPEALAAAVREAKGRLEAALATYSRSGDLHVNLAAIALLENDVARCKAEMEKVVEVGDISPDALPVFYNLGGLVALRERRFIAAAVEFEKVKEFRPDWDIPMLNLGAAHAQVLLSPKTDPTLANRSAATLRRVLGGLRKAENPLCGPMYEALAYHHLRTRQPRTGPADALLAFGEAARFGKLSPPSLANRAVAAYLGVRYTARRTGADPFAEPAAEMAKVLANPKAGPRERLMASCILGSIEAERRKPKEAIAHFQRALPLADQARDALSKAIAARIHSSLGTLYYEVGQLMEALEHFEKAKDTPDVDERKRLEIFLSQSRSAPTIGQFEARRDVLFTAFDLQVSAQLATPSSPEPLGPENVTLILADELSGTTRPLPFQLNGPALHAAAVNLPQGKYRLKLTLTDAFGGRAEAQSEAFEFDREPPRLANRKPEPGATISSLKAIEFDVEDSLSSVDLATLRVNLRYPPGTPLLTRTLVAGGKYQFPSPNGAIPRGAPVTAEVRAPMPQDKLPKGEYRVTVHVKDTKGNARDMDWAFKLAP